MPKGCGGRSGVCVCMHADRHMHTYTYGTAKETGQMLVKDLKLTAPKHFKKHRIKNVVRKKLPLIQLLHKHTKFFWGWGTEL
jgi:hypothetical protein